jgi:hypothetical protein
LTRSGGTSVRVLIPERELGEWGLGSRYFSESSMAELCPERDNETRQLAELEAVS